MIHYNTFTLSNGLRVVHNYDPSTVMVAVNILYNVGARDESPELTGMAHLMEHLMFGGSVNIPAFDRAIEDAGGSNNAWTSNDFTNYYDIAPAVNFETLLWLESDRMLGLNFNPKSLEVQRSVVIEEFKETHLNAPYGDLMHHLRALVYKRHPYRWPTIGLTPEHIERVTPDDVRNFFYSHYAPNNAVLAISGHVTFDEARRAVEHWFGDIPSRPIAPRQLPEEDPIDHPRHLTVTGRVPRAVITLAYPMPAHGEPGYIEADLITDILASGRSSRFYRRLVMEGKLFTEADASILGSNERGILMLRGHVADPSPRALDHAAEMLQQEAMQLCHEASAAHPDGVTSQELERAVNRYLSERAFSSMSYVSRAQKLSNAILLGEDINAIPEAYKRVTTADIASAARSILIPSRQCRLDYLPEDA